MKSRDRREKRRERKVSAARRMAEHSDGKTKLAFRLPKGVNLYQCKKPGSYRWEIIPFDVGKYNPYFSEGEYGFERTYYTHQRIGPSGETRLCLAMIFKKKCSLCNRKAALSRDYEANKEEIKNLKYKERQLFNLWDRKNEEKVVELFEVSTFAFGAQLDKKIKEADPEEKEQYEQFASPDSGMTVKVTASEESAGEGSGKYMYFDNIEFKPREKAIPDSILEQAVKLDDLLDPAVFDAANFKKNCKSSLDAWCKWYDAESMKLYNGGEDDEEDDRDDDEDADEENDNDEDEDETDDDDSEDDDGNGEQEGVGYSLAKGDKVKFTHRGKTVIGIVKKILKEEEELKIFSKKTDRMYTIPMGDETLTLIGGEQIPF